MAKRYRYDLGEWFEDHYEFVKENVKKYGPDWFKDRIHHDVIGSKYEYSDDGAVFTGISINKLGSEEEVKEFFNIDTDKWRIKKWVCQAMSVNMKLKDTKTIGNKVYSFHRPHQSVNYNVRVELEPIEMQIKIIDRLQERYSSFVPPKYKPRKLKHTDRCAVVNLYDAHLDKITLKSETGEEQSLESNVERYKDGIRQVVDYLEFLKPEIIFYPIGNDLYHSNAMNGQTKKGQQLQYLTSPEEAYYVISELALWSVYQLANISPVRIPMIHGNHDKDKITILGFWLEKMFEGDGHISINKSRLQRKYEQYGKNMFGFAHGDKERKQMHRMPLFMAQEQPEMWANTTYRRFYLGDLHHSKEYQFLKTSDQVGVTVEHLRSIGGVDEWHHECGWIGIPKTAYVHDFSKDASKSNRHEINYI